MLPVAPSSQARETETQSQILSSEGRRRLESPLLTVGEAATYLRVSRSTFYLIMEKKELRVVRIRGRVFVHSQDIDDYINQQTAYLASTRNGDTL